MLDYDIPAVQQVDGGSRSAHHHRCHRRRTVTEGRVSLQFDEVTARSLAGCAAAAAVGR